MFRFTIECAEKEIKSVDISVAVGVVESSREDDREETETVALQTRYSTGLGQPAGGLQLGRVHRGGGLFGDGHRQLGGGGFVLQGGLELGGSGMTSGSGDSVVLSELGTVSGGVAGGGLSSESNKKRKESLKDKVTLKDFSEAPLK